MRCSMCSSDLPEGANYCSHCGARQFAAGVASAQREICEIYRSGEKGSWFRAGDTYWEAIAVGPTGRYCVGRSEPCPRRGRGATGGVERADALLDQLIAKLAQEGWLPIPRGPEWYSHRFERISARSPLDDQTPAGMILPADPVGGGDA